MFGEIQTSKVSISSKKFNEVVDSFFINHINSLIFIEFHNKFYAVVKIHTTDYGDKLQLFQLTSNGNWDYFKSQVYLFDAKDDEEGTTYLSFKNFENDKFDYKFPIDEITLYYVNL